MLAYDDLVDAFDELQKATGISTKKSAAKEIRSLIKGIANGQKDVDETEVHLTQELVIKIHEYCKEVLASHDLEEAIELRNLFEEIITLSKNFPTDLKGVEGATHIKINFQEVPPEELELNFDFSGLMNIAKPKIETSEPHDLRKSEDFQLPDFKALKDRAYKKPEGKAKELLDQISSLLTKEGKTAELRELMGKWDHLSEDIFNDLPKRDNVHTLLRTFTEANFGEKIQILNQIVPNLQALYGSTAWDLFRNSAAITMLKVINGELETIKTQLTELTDLITGKNNTTLYEAQVIEQLKCIEQLAQKMATQLYKFSITPNRESNTEVLNAIKMLDKIGAFTKDFNFDSATSNLKTSTKLK
jgi:hypothetical protein